MKRGEKMKKLLVFLCTILLVFSVVGTAGAVQFIDNGGFETGDLTAWSASLNIGAQGTWWDISPTEGDFQAVMSMYFGVFDSDLSQSLNIDPALYTEATISFDFNLKALDTSKWLEWGTQITYRLPMITLNFSGYTLTTHSGVEPRNMAGIHFLKPMMPVS